MYVDVSKKCEAGSCEYHLLLCLVVSVTVRQCDTCDTQP